MEERPGLPPLPNAQFRTRRLLELRQRQQDSAHAWDTEGKGSLLDGFGRPEHVGVRSHLRGHNSTPSSAPTQSAAPTTPQYHPDASGLQWATGPSLPRMAPTDRGAVSTLEAQQMERALGGLRRRHGSDTMSRADSPGPSALAPTPVPAQWQAQVCYCCGAPLGNPRDVAGYESAARVEALLAQRGPARSPARAPIARGQGEPRLEQQSLPDLARGVRVGQPMGPNLERGPGRWHL